MAMADDQGVGSANLVERANRNFVVSATCDFEYLFTEESREIHDAIAPCVDREDTMAKKVHGRAPKELEHEPRIQEQ